MKHSLLLMGIVALFFTACKDEDKTDPGSSTSAKNGSGVSSQDTTLPITEKLNSVNFSRNIIIDRAVDPVIAQHCVDEMKRTFKGTDLAALQKSYSESVTFGSVNLKDWLTNYDVLAKSDSIAIRFGVYTDEAIKAWGIDASHKGRLTAFIWPYKIDPQAKTVSTVTDPFNVGSLNP